MFFLCVLLLAGSALGADLTVTRLTADCTVEKNGSCRMTHKLELNVPRAKSEITVPVGTQVRDITVTGADHTVVTKDGGSYVTLRGAEDFAGDVTVEISFLTGSRPESTEDKQNLSVELVSDLWECAIERFSFHILLPAGVTAKPTFASGYHGGEIEDKLTVQTEGPAISGMLRGGLLDRDSFCATLAVPAGTFPGNSDAAAISGAAQWILTVLILLLTALAVFYHIRYLQWGRLHPQARTLLPDGMTPAELPYLLCGEAPNAAGLLCYWASLGYLTIQERGGERLLLRRNMAMGSERREEEQKLFALLFSGSDLCEVGDRRWLKFTELTAKALRNYWNRRIFDRGSGNPLLVRLLAALVSGLALLCTMNVMLPAFGVKWLILIAAFFTGAVCGGVIWYACGRAVLRDWKWTAIGGAAVLMLYLLGRFGGGLLTILLALVLDVAVGLGTLHGGRLTAAGCDAVEQSMGYLRYLRHAEAAQLALRQREDPQYFYQTLISAESVGLGASFAARMEDAAPEPCQWLTFAGETAMRPAQFRTKFAEVFAQLRKIG